MANSCTYGRRSVDGQGDIPPRLFEVEGTTCVLSPYVFGGRHFCAIRWIIEAIFVKFSQLILMKIIKIVAKQMSDFKAKMHQIQYRLGLCPKPCWGAYSAPWTPSWI